MNQGNLASSLANIIATYELTPEDRSLVVMPLFHVHGLMAGQPPTCHFYFSSAVPWPACVYKAADQPLNMNICCSSDERPASSTSLLNLLLLQ